MQHDKTKTLERFDALFGYGWKAAYARAIGIDVATVKRMQGPTERHAAVILDFLETTQPKHWPQGFKELRDLYTAQLRKEQQT